MSATIRQPEPGEAAFHGSDQPRSLVDHFDNSDMSKWPVSNLAYPDGRLPCARGGDLKCPFCSEVVKAAADVVPGEIIKHDCPYVPEGWNRVE